MRLPYQWKAVLCILCESCEGNVKTKIVRSGSFDPYHNLALEEYMLRRVDKNEVILYIWQNKETVVIGRNQNPWKECRCRELEESGGRLARRLSGGGAVFHDLGNLNFTFITRRRLYNFEKQLQVLLNTARKLGVDARFTGRNDITADGRKFSGNAFYFVDDFAYHHGTILLDADFTKLTEYLQVSKEKIVSKGIDSVSSRVVNLKELNGSITVESAVESLKASFIEIYGGLTSDGFSAVGFDEIKPLYEKYSSWDWKYGETPRFDISFEKRFPWGGMDVRLSLKDGRVDNAFIYSDAMNGSLIYELKSLLPGTAFTKDAIKERLLQLKADSDEDRAVIEDIAGWLDEKVH